ncbi:MAG: tRNA 2-selenouridine(34) synthase MnmH [Burkholderiaceae bacterium]|nr:tRNA 2-selenouridine(34) synthase MnmH [Burkholderiaceae bacterium]
MHEDTSDFRALFLADLPLMDVRAPIEFNRGAFPTAVNLPLLDDIQRQKIGCCYKREGQQAATQLGHQLVTGQLKAMRIEAWATFAKANPEGYLYCFRGGLRSQIVQQWLKDLHGISYPRITGGYKALRSFLMENTEQALKQCHFLLLGGLTGTGKTQVLQQLNNSLDLEGYANHRGSSFGKRLTPQPAQIDFEHCLAIHLLKKQAAGQTVFVLEDEGRMVGSCTLPLSLYQGMHEYPLIWLEDTLENRVQRILADYVISLCEEFCTLHGEEEGLVQFGERMQLSLKNIAKRLGNGRYQRLANIMEMALIEQQRSADLQLHCEWIETLLVEYYDPMYLFQCENKNRQIVFKGNQVDVLEYLRHASLQSFMQRQQPGR